MFEPVAIIGMSCNFPGARNYNEYWENLCNGVVSYGQIASELLVDGYRSVKGIINDPELFEPSRYNIGEKEAELMDPQMRKFIELVEEALADADYAGGKGLDCVGVIASQGTNRTYHDELEALKTLGIIPAPNRLLENVNRGPDFLSTRISYHFNFSGPSFNLQAGCSSALVSVVEAAFLLQSGRCDAVIAGGINITFPLDEGYLYERGSILSDKGVCRPFDSKADGTIPSNGGGAVLLKRLSKARQDDDVIHAVIRAAGTNNDGRQKVSFAAPSVKGQYQLLKDVYSRSAINPTALKFIECHATGTVVGDPIEVRSINQLLNDYDLVRRDDTLLLGSVKGNLGHLFWSSGMASLIKAVLSLKYGIYPGTANFEDKNPLIELDPAKLRVNRETCSLTDSACALGGVSSFGVGGTNAHVVLERYLDKYISRESLSISDSTIDDREKAKVYSLIVRRGDAARSGRTDHVDAYGSTGACSMTLVQKIIKLYENTLGAAPLNADSNYFDFYGDSLTAVTLIFEIKREFMVDISNEDIFQFPTPKLLAKCVESRRDNGLQRGFAARQNPVNEKDFNDFQARFYLLEKLQRGDYSNYNVAICLDIDSGFDRSLFHNSLESVLESIPSFRKQIKWTDTGLVLGEDRKSIIEVDDVNIDSKTPIREQYGRIFGKRFRIESGSTCRISYIQHSGIQQVAINIPHLLIDGKGMDNFLRAVGQRMMGPDSVSACYCPRVIDALIPDLNRKFWISYLSGFEATILPYTNTNNNANASGGNQLVAGEEYFRIDRTLHAAMQEVCLQWHITPYVLLYSIFNLYLSEICGVGRVCTGTTLVNRNAETAGIIGCFINNIPVAVDLSDVRKIGSVIEITRRSLALGMENSLVPFDVIVSDNGSSGIALYRILFMFQNQNRGYSLQVDGKAYRESEIKYAPLYCDICVNVMPAGKDTSMSITYDPSLYTAPYISNFCSGYLSMIDRCITELVGGRRAKGN